MRRSLLLSLLALAGCKTGLLDAPDADASFQTPDLARLACTTHSLVTVPLASLELNGLAPIAGAALRLMIGVSLRPCDLLGPIDVSASPGNATDFVTLTAHAWRRSDDCGAPSSFRWEVTIPTSGNPFVQVSDGGGGNQSLRVELGARPIGATCTGAGSIGDACGLSCQCGHDSDLAQCLPFSTAKQVCAIPCAEDADCPVSRPVCKGDVCAPMPEDCPCDSARCPFGQKCDVCGCRPAQKATFAKCACDSECGFGEICTGNGICRVPCITVHDCPSGLNVCAQGGCDSTT